MREPSTVAGCLSFHFNERVLRDMPTNRWQACKRFRPCSEALLIPKSIGHTNQKWAAGVVLYPRSVHSADIKFAGFLMNMTKREW
jgi:hypothetical protein